MTDVFPTDARAGVRESPEVALIAADLLRRLRPVLSDMPEPELHGLVRRIAVRRHRWNIEDSVATLATVDLPA